MVWPGGTANSGKGLFTLLSLKVAALGELHGAADDFGRVGEELFHLLGAFYVELVGVEFEALGVVDGVRGLHAEQDFVGVVVVFAEVVAVVGGDEGDVELFFHAEEVGVDFLFQFEALVLDFEEEVSAAEDFLVLAGGFFGVFVFAGHEVGADFSGEAAGEADEAFGMFGEVVFADAGLAVEAVERGF